ncbi:MAG TPA: PH domain-containing protein [Segeticoccus sp.]|uniref:PH domain-containing protein n=1 Tax=Segeticoccus sp. TaxID=2706531 RepID=UPI002D7F4357|nr:PH domain-containing protein [Segeticoccus sp.]HET8600424.1 PH domain-containing protein [Segeticoccus sp.]
MSDPEPPPPPAPSGPPVAGRLSGLPEADSEWRRLSARMLLIHPVREVGRFIPALIGLFFAGSSTGTGQWWSLVGLAAVVGLSIMRWVTTRYRITPEQVQLTTGLFHRKTLATPADRVRTVDVTANLMHRLLGLAKVEIGTASGSDKDRLTLDALPADDAARLRAELLHRTGGAARSEGRGTGVGAGEDRALPRSAGHGTGADTPPPSRRLSWPAPSGMPATRLPDPEEEVLLALDPGWIRFAPFTLSGLITGLAILGVGSRILDDLGTNDQEKWGYARTLWQQVAGETLWVAVLIVLVAVLIGASVLAIGGYVLSFWGFRLTRHRRGTLQVSRGLITTRATSVELRRLRGVEVVEPILLRIPRGGRLLALTTGLRSRGGEGSNNNAALLCPPAPAEVVRATGAQVLQDGQALTQPLLRHGHAARQRRVFRALVFPALVVVALAVVHGAGAPVPGWAPVVALVLLPLGILLGLDRYRNLGHALTPRFLIRQEGSLVRRRAALERDGVIGWNLRQTFFQRRAGLATLTATTAAGGGYYEVMDLAPERALALADDAVPGLLRDFLVEAPGEPRRRSGRQLPRRS